MRKSINKCCCRQEYVMLYWCVRNIFKDFHCVIQGCLKYPWLLTAHVMGRANPLQICPFPSCVAASQSLHGAVVGRLKAHRFSNAYSFENQICINSTRASDSSWTPLHKRKDIARTISSWCVLYGTCLSEKSPQLALLIPCRSSRRFPEFHRFPLLQQLFISGAILPQLNLIHVP